MKKLIDYQINYRQIKISDNKNVFLYYIPIQSHQEFVRKYINLKQDEHSPVPLLYLFTYKRQRIQGKKEKKEEQNYEHFTVDRRKQ